MYCKIIRILILEDKMFKKYLLVFLISMVPLIELRGAIPYAVGFNLNMWIAYAIAILKR